MWYVVCVKDLNGDWNYITTSHRCDENGNHKLILSHVYSDVYDKNQWCARKYMSPIGRPFVEKEYFKRASELAKKSGAAHFICSALEYVRAENDPLKIIDGGIPHPGAVYSRLEGF